MKPGTTLASIKRAHELSQVDKKVVRKNSQHVLRGVPKTVVKVTLSP